MLGDRIGPRRVLTRIVLWWSAFTALTGAVSSYPLLLAVRFLFGAGEAGTFPNTATVVGRWIPLSERARATSVIWTATAAGAILTPLIVVPIQKSVWMASFLLAVRIAGHFLGGAVVLVVSRHAGREAGSIGGGARTGSGRRFVPPAMGFPGPTLFRDWNFLRLLLMYHTYC